MPPFRRVRLLTREEHAHSFCRCVLSLAFAFVTCEHQLLLYFLWDLRHTSEQALKDQRRLFLIKHIFIAMSIFYILIFFS